jgi:hypothetical protein
MSFEELQNKLQKELYSQSLIIETPHLQRQYISMEIVEQYFSMIYGAGFDEGRKTLCNQKQVEQVLDGEVIKVWNSQMEASRTLGFDHSGISKCVTGERKKYQGFEWHEKSPVI